jgi:hypothetical protein
VYHLAICDNDSTKQLVVYSRYFGGGERGAGLEAFGARYVQPPKPKRINMIRNIKK